ncbi:beta-lactamase family protein [Kibdelosporangium philippinense]|uniref:Beta-lactamase family protein n=1 Tax=Kibdelosporangium philippinense TaxID=211113 RepID=A0ABS8ZPY1_9PSEU|nr:serine hydrolase domain-containing protein [Kibdelosporangium philippinense]MCE7009814.1 beta-lactamase family protein [Kibdelosporangium philippinense]
MDLAAYVDSGVVPAAVSLVARGDDVEVRVAGPVKRDSIFRIASMTKPIVAAALMVLVEDGKVALADRVDKWLPELADLQVVRTPQSPVEDVVPASRPITVFDLLTSRAGYGLPTDFSLPAAQSLFDFTFGPPPLDEWLTQLTAIPMLAQPGETFLYNTCSDIQGVLIARISGQSLPDFLAERVFGPLGMTDTAFEVPAAKQDRFTTLYTHDLEVSERPGEAWTSLPAFASGAGGLVSTADDWLKFGRALLDHSLLSRESITRMTTDHLTAEQRRDSEIFLEGQGWGFGGSVDVTARNPWNVPGRYGWTGGLGTAAHIIPSTGTVTILLTQVTMTSATAPQIMRDFWRANTISG